MSDAIEPAVPEPQDWRVMEDLLDALERRGIDTSEWDGEDGPIEAVANGIAKAIGDAAPILPAEGTAAFERLAEAVHNAWWREKEQQGGADTHPDAIPYEQLSEDVKEYDRATVRTVLNALAAQEDT